MMQIEAPRCCRGYQDLHLLEDEGMVFGHAYGDQTVRSGNCLLHITKVH